MMKKSLNRFATVTLIVCGTFFACKQLTNKNHSGFSAINIGEVPQADESGAPLVYNRIELTWAIMQKEEKPTPSDFVDAPVIRFDVSQSGLPTNSLDFPRNDQETYYFQARLIQSGEQDQTIATTLLGSSTCPPVPVKMLDSRVALNLTLCTSAPGVNPSASPSAFPSANPTSFPSVLPSANVTSFPDANPSVLPTLAPTQAVGTTFPSPIPTGKSPNEIDTNPTVQPTQIPANPGQISQGGGTPKGIATVVFDDSDPTVSPTSAPSIKPSPATKPALQSCFDNAQFKDFTTEVLFGTHYSAGKNVFTKDKNGVVVFTKDGITNHSDSLIACESNYWVVVEKKKSWATLCFKIPAKQKVPEEKTKHIFTPKDLFGRAPNLVSDPEFKLVCKK